MKLEPIQTTDKLGRPVVLRSAEPTDALALIDFLKITATETNFLIREPNEITITEEQECCFIDNKLQEDREILLVATLDGKHIGNCALMSVAPFKRFAHRCEIAIALYKEYCGYGIGKVMVQTLLDVAKNLGYEQAELEVVADNHAAVALYEMLGFKKCSILPRIMKYADGTYADGIRMIKVL